VEVLFGFKRSAMIPSLLERDQRLRRLPISHKDEASEKRVGPCEFLFVPGGHKHSSGGDKTEGALFYQDGSGKFDRISAH
jgi:hypothetical protein